MTFRLPRRTFLRGAGVCVALPLLEAMMHGTSRAGEADAVKRFVVFFSGNGTIDEAWRPQGGELDFTFTRSDGGTHILAPLEAHRDDLIVLAGVDMASRSMGPGGNGHDLGMGHMLTCRELVPGPQGEGEFGHLPDGSAGGISIDQQVADLIGGKTPFRSFEFGVQFRLDTARQITSYMSYKNAFEPVPPEVDPRAAFDSLFSGLSGDPGEVAELRARRQSVLDKVRDDFARLNPKLGTRDRQKLEAHLEAIREIEQTLTNAGGALEGCEVPGAPGEFDPLHNDNYPLVGQLQIDLLSMALTCDLTRVATLQWTHGQSGTRFSWLGHTDAHHSLSHEADDDGTIRNMLVDINHWYAQQFAYLLDRMKAIPEGDGTMLDNTVVIWVNEQGNGDTHSSDNIPMVIAGSGGGYLRTGRFLDYGGVPHNDLYVSMLHAMGHDEIESFGIPELCGGPLPGLT
jgi:hypothetical protein